VLALLLFLQLHQAPGSAPVPAATTPAPANVEQPASFEGRGAPNVTVPRIEAAVHVDGQLDEEVWRRAVRLTGFSQYRPVDSRPAEEQTEVLVWYSATALHFGIVARDRQADSIRATVADRDNLSRDDTVTIYLDTFSDRRRAFFFTVNPLGIQEDGVQSEGSFNAGTMFGGTNDKNPDYQWDSKGRVTGEGYVVEIRIPFKSLRYPSNGEMRWGFNVQRKTQRTGYEDTWTDVKRASSSFLAQAGGLQGLHDLKRGVVTEIQPFFTVANNGTRTPAGDFTRGSSDFNPGANLRLGFTNISVDATVNPDFSQVESDAGQVTANQRFALYYAEKRPFFLEGIELFSTPNQLVYSRQITNPLVGGKVTGKVGRLNVAYLSAKEKEDSGGAFFNVARVRRDIGTDSTVGVTFTDRTESGDFNRVLAADSRVIFKKLYYVQGQIGRSWTEAGGIRQDAPVWLAEVDRTGRAWGFNYKLTGFGRGFSTRTGYVPRNDIVESHASNRFSWYGKRGALIEQFTTFFGPTRIWRYADFGRRSPIEGNENMMLMANARGGWVVRGGIRRDFVRFDPEDYAHYAVETSAGLVPFVLPEKLSNLMLGSLAVSTPAFRRFNASVDGQRAQVAIFPEATEGRETRVVTTLALRPSESIRAEFSNTFSRITRARDGSEFARTIIPRIKTEYQPTRAFFFRVIGEYRSQRQAALLDPWAWRPIHLSGRRADATNKNGLRLDFLLSYKPTPGTVAFFGYGSSMDTDQTLSLRDLRRQNDGFFVKLAYLIRR
jgi:hypothetical protein